jgi:hypothetical protein
MRFRIYAVVLLALVAFPAAAQVTHLGVPASQMVSVQFVPTAQDIPGRLSGIYIYTNSSNTSPTYYAIPPGYTLVITDLDFQVNSGTTSQAGYSSLLRVSNAGFPEQGHPLAAFEPQVTLSSPPVLIKAMAHVHFTAGFAFTPTSTPSVEAGNIQSDVRIFARAGGYLTQ